MPKVISVIPPTNPLKEHSVALCNGTKVLLDDGSYLENIQKITLVAEPDQPWRAIIELTPKNQEQIDAILSDLKVVNGHETPKTTDQATDNNTEETEA